MADDDELVLQDVSARFPLEVAGYCWTNMFGGRMEYVREMIHEPCPVKRDGRPSTSALLEGVGLERAGYGVHNLYAMLTLDGLDHRRRYVPCLALVGECGYPVETERLVRNVFNSRTQERTTAHSQAAGESLVPPGPRVCPRWS